MARTISHMGMSFALLTALVACASVPPPMPPITLQWTSPEKRVILVRPVFDLSERWVDGHLSARSDWGDLAETMTVKQVSVIAAMKGIHLVSVDASPDVPNVPKCTEQEFYTGSTKDLLHTFTGADYALCIHASEWYSSPGRSAVDTAAAVVLIPLLLPICLQSNFCGEAGLGDVADCPANNACARAALVDLRSGLTVWEQTMNTHDWRNELSVKGAVDELLKKAPF